MNSLVSNEHSILTAIWHMPPRASATKNPNHYKSCAENNAVLRLQELGYIVTHNLQEAG